MRNIYCRDPPAAYHCAFQDAWGGSDTGQIKYDNVGVLSSLIVIRIILILIF